MIFIFSITKLFHHQWLSRIHGNVLDKKTSKLTGGVEVSAYDYEVNALGQRESVAMSGSAFSGSSALGWSYDAQGQLIAADHSASSAKDQAFLYDSIGNRKREVHGGLSLPGSDSYTTDAENQYSSSPSNSSLSHDSDGNMTSGQVPSDPGAGGVETSGSFEDTSNIVWDAENRLVQIKVRKGGASSHRLLNYEYDYLGRRIKRIKTQNSVVSIFHFAYGGWNPLNFVVEKVGGPEIAQKYTWGKDLSGSMQGAGGVGGLLVTEFVNSGAVLDDFYYPVYDGNGNVCQYLDSNGNADARFEYDSFGRIVSNTGEEVRKSLRHRFSTKHRDVHSGLYYYGYRYYNPVTGRWLSRDPIEENGGINLYGFIGNDGINDTDYLGMQVQRPFMGATKGKPTPCKDLKLGSRSKKPCCCIQTWLTNKYNDPGVFGFGAGEYGKWVPNGSSIDRGWHNGNIIIPSVEVRDSGKCKKRPYTVVEADVWDDSKLEPSVDRMNDNIPNFPKPHISLGPVTNHTVIPDGKVANFKVQVRVYAGGSLCHCTEHSISPTRASSGGSRRGYKKM